MKKNRFDTFFHPFVILIYGTLAYNLHLLARFGEKRKRIPLILLSALFLLGWFIVSVYRERKKKKNTSASTEKKFFSPTVYTASAALVLLVITFLTGKSLYQSAQAGQGQLSYYVDQYLNEKELSFTEKNLYKDGLNGIFLPLDEQFTLPKEFYIASDFLINFKKNGRITAFDGEFYGKNEEGESESYILSYNEERSTKMTVSLNREVEKTYAEDKKLDPLFDLLEHISLEEAAISYLEDEYRLTYTGIVFRGALLGNRYEVTEDGTVLPIDPDVSGYTLTLYGKTRDIPEDVFAHYIYVGAKTVTNEEFEQRWEDEKEPINWEIGYNIHDGVESYFITKEVGYQLAVADAALGTRYYALLQTTDGGNNWEIWNPDPFLGEGGGSAGITFLDESLGFSALSKQSGTQATLYRTIDGGQSYEPVTFPIVEVPLTSQETYEAFTFPGMPVEKDGQLYVSVGQGADGDYKGGISALFVSSDRGETWTFIGEEPLEKNDDF